ncbi:hypothetical protein SLA2020_023170 [Shorea laevis]
MGTQLKTVSISSPCRKRLLADLPKPNSAAPPDPPPYKKTRDLPNLSECHSCNSRADVATGRNRIQFLYSEWRIVLLCRRCLSCVQSSEICSYCFKESSQDCIYCSRCKHSVHKTCFLKFKSIAPWSYSCSGTEFSVCVDCWVPDYIARRRGILKSCKPGNSRVLDSGDCTPSLQDVVKDANCAAEEKVEAAARARELAEKKAAVARQAVELASNALNLAAMTGRYDDEKLALQLHRAINSSPRISKNRDLCSLSVSEPRVAVRALDNLKPRTIVYSRRLKKGESQKICGVELQTKDGVRRCFSKLLYPSEVDSHTNLESKTCYHQDSYTMFKSTRPLLKYSRRYKGTRLDGKPDLCLFKYSRRSKGTESVEKPDQCLLKYSRKKSSSKAVLDVKTLFL